MAPKKITVIDAIGANKELVGSEDGYRTLLSRFGGVACLVDGDGFNANDYESLVDGGTYTLGPPIQQQQQQQQRREQSLDEELLKTLQSMNLSIHGMQQVLPSVIVGHVVTPSTASRDRNVSAQIFDAVGLPLRPADVDGVHNLPEDLQGDTKWNFTWKWPTMVGQDDRVLERAAYAPVLHFLRELGFEAEDVSEGQNCVEKRLYNSDIYTPRLQNPLEVRGQKVYHCHRVQGRTDLVVLRQSRNGGEITRRMVQCAIEIKTVPGLNQSKDGCLLEAQLQLIGLNAFNVFGSPPVVLTNLARTHQVLYLDYREDGWTHVIKVKKCNTFAASIHFAMQKATEMGVSANFSRPMTPELDE